MDKGLDQYPTTPVQTYDLMLRHKKQMIQEGNAGRGSYRPGRGGSGRDRGVRHHQFVQQGDPNGRRSGGGRGNGGGTRCIPAGADTIPGTN